MKKFLLLAQLLYPFQTFAIELKAGLSLIPQTKYWLEGESYLKTLADESQGAFSFSMVPMPFARSMIELKKGRIDIDFARAGYAYGPMDPVIKIKESMGRLPIVAISLKKNCYQDFKALQPYPTAVEVNHLILHKICEREQLHCQDTLDYSTTWKQMIREKIGSALVTAWYWNLAIDSNSADFSPDAFCVSPPIYTEDLFVFIHKKHHNLVPIFERLLKKHKFTLNN